MSRIVSAVLSCAFAGLLQSSVAGGVMQAPPRDASASAERGDGIIRGRVRWASWAQATRETQPNRSGKFRHEGLRPGKYFIVALTPDERLLLNPGSGRTHFERLASIATPVEVTENEVREVALTLAQLPGPDR